MVSKDTATLSQLLQCIMLYSMHILYKPGVDLYIVDWLSCHGYTENRDKAIAGINIGIHTISMAVDVSIWNSIEDIRSATREDAEL